MAALNGYTVLELGGIGPAPMACMVLADMGADVIRIERIGATDPLAKSAPLDNKTSGDISHRGKKSVCLNLKSQQGQDTLLRMVQKADVLVDPFRPGVCEKLGIGPEACLEQNPRLVFARMTGWGQDGPLAQAAGHDINYIALTGALHAIGHAGSTPVPPLNLVGDYGGGGMLLLAGILAALLETNRSGRGQVVDAAMVDGSAQLMGLFHGLQAVGRWNAESREDNFLDGGAHFYSSYECADGRYICIGSIEPQFYARLLELAGLDQNEFQPQWDSSEWPAMKAKLTGVFLQKSRQDWCDLLEGSEACFSPVLTLTEAPQHPANIARDSYIEIDGIVQPAPAPRFSRTPSRVRHGIRDVGTDTREVLNGMGFSATEIDALALTGDIYSSFRD